ncbi:MAG TPA: hypothetical protein VFI24_21890 [Pyrinomonadaceae bacterium]|nr:hypothetical protein [Pyrinomonadaceae bacterium]
MKPFLTVSLLLLVRASVSFGQTSDCTFNANPCEAYAKADAVFIGKVQRISPQFIEIWQRDKDYDQTANISIEKVYKGPKLNHLVLHQLGRKIAPKFILGSRYVFYANLDRRTRRWEVRYCGRTRMAQYSQDDLSYLNGLPASLNKTRIAGEVTRYEKDEENPQGITTRLSGVRIRIKGEGKEYEAVTDAHGMYEFLNVPAGQYTIEPDLPAGLVLLFAIHYGPLDLSKIRSLKIEVREGECSGVGIALTSNSIPGKPKIGNE